MKNRYNSINDSIFSAQYKIPYSKQSIESHLEESQEEINFIKLKLTEAYQKLEIEIQTNNDLEETNEELTETIKQIEEKYQYQKKQNTKLKETLEVILKNRKILQEESEEIKESFNRKIIDKDKIIEQLSSNINRLTQKCTSLTAECENKDRLLKDFSERLRDQSFQKQVDSQRQIALMNKIQLLEQEISKITEEKYIEVNRLRHQLQLYQRSSSPFPNEIRIEEKEKKPQSRKRDFAPPNVKENEKMKKFNTKNSEDTQFDFNKENLNSLQVNPLTCLEQSSVVKWKRPTSVKESYNNQTTPYDNSVSPLTGPLNDDQQLTFYQQSKKKAEQELVTLEKIKRPSNTERQKIARLERQLYHLDSDIAGLKRKIRRKY